MTFLQNLYERAAHSGKTVILPESQDPRVLDAADALVLERLATPVFLARPERPVPGSVLIDELAPPDASQRCVDWLVAKNRRKALSPDGARDMLRAPLVRAAALVGAGIVDLGIAGSIATTAEVVRAGLLGIGLKQGCRLVSSSFLMQFNDRVCSYGDCAVITDPDAAQLAHIAINCATAHAALTAEVPRVAMLSFSTFGSAEHPSIARVREAVAIARAARPDLEIEGELQYDAAIDPEIGRRKAPGSAIAGRCNVMVFPDINAGNIAYKIAQREAGARATGPLLLGFDKPWMDLSRGCSSRDIVDLCVLAMLLD